MSAVQKDVTCYSKMRDIGYRFGTVHKGTFGIELETETKSHEDYPNGFFKEDTSSGFLRYRVPMEDWEGHVDNSLRNYGMEFVLKKPLVFEESIKALDNFHEVTKDIKFIKNAPSTSVHVHVNMLNEAPSVMANFLALYTLFENVLVDYSGESRRSNLFALPIRAASATVDNINCLIKMFIQNNHNLLTFNPQSVKYAAINLAPITKFGSLELRSFRGETDIEEVKDWIRIVNSLLMYAKTPGLTPRIVLFEYKIRGVSYFDEVFKDMAEKIRSRVNDVSELMDRNLWYLMKIATVTNDWESIDVPMEKKDEKKSKRSSTFGGITVEQANEMLAQAGVQMPAPTPTVEIDWETVNSLESDWNEEEDDESDF